MAIETLGSALGPINRLLADGTITGFSDAQLLERFLAGHDAAAFEALVAHHGPMVLSVCRGILKDPNDAEDAFQATFLILVKKSGTLRRHESLGPWLYQVAHRVAIRANAAAARRRACERRAGQMAATTSESGPALPDEPLQDLHEEIARLPDRLRRPVILCELQRVPQARAAAELRLSERTLQRRLSQGRERLKARLIRRGLAPEGTALGSAFLGAARLAVPPAWSQAAVRAALATVDHSLTAGIVSAAAQELTREVLGIMLLKKLTLTSAVLMAGGLIAWGASATLISPQEGPSQKVAARPNVAPQPKAEKAASRPGPNAVDPPAKVMVRGRVLGPDGRPVAGAKLYRTSKYGYNSEPFSSPETATSGPDGRFEFAVAEPENDLEPAVVAATAANYGVAFVEVLPEGPSDDLALQLVEDQPISGQIVDLEGKPVPGATLQVLMVRAAVGEDLGPWLEAAKAKKERSYELEERFLPRLTIAPAPKFTADAQGRFQITGIGRNRLVVAQLDGPTIASQQLHILTRPGGALTVVRLDYPPQPTLTTTYYGASFRYAAAPTKPIVGVVRDKDTKAPLAGAMIISYELATVRIGGTEMVRTTTDAQGRYRLVGMPKGEGNRIKVVPGKDEPYLVSLKDVPDSPGLDAVQVDFELRRGVWIVGKITDKVTGKPLRPNLGVWYSPQPNNPNLSAYGCVPGGTTTAEAHKDGSYRLAGMPGPGVVALRVVRGFLRAHERDDEFGVKELHFPTMTLPTMNFSAIARIDAAQGVESVERDVTLDPGWTFTGTVLGPDGRPLAGAWGIGLSSWNIDGQVMKTAEFTVSQFNPRHPRPLLFQYPQKGLVGVGQPPKNRGESITVQLRPGATITGRLVDAVGRPRPGVRLVIWRHHEETAQPMDSTFFPPQPDTTDEQGRFRLAGLLPGYEFILYDGKGIVPLGKGLSSGETKDLGDVKIGDE
jgi:RNA polymerase sigma factor (sigma-70 family)